MSIPSGALPPVTIKAVFGDGYLGQAFSGIGRVQALVLGAYAVTIVGELTLRGLTNAVEAVGFQPKPDNWLVKGWNAVSKKTGDVTGGRIHAYSPKVAAQGLSPEIAEKNSTKILIIRAVACTVLSIVAFDIMTLLGGRTPPVYNRVLTFIGPFRINDEFYYTNVRNALTGTWVGGKIGL